MSDAFDPMLALEAYFAGEIEPDDAARLRGWIEANPDQFNEVVERAKIHSYLSMTGVRYTTENIMDEVLAAVPADDSLASENVSLSGARRGRAMRQWAAVFLAGAALAVLAGVAAFFVLARGEKEVATIVAADDVVWKSKPLTSGDVIGQGEIHIEAGHLQVKLASQAELKVEGSVQLEVLTAKTVRVHRGTAEFLCPAEARGFTVELPGGTEVVDLGTQFAVEVGPDGESHVSVTQGRVEVRAAGESPVVVTAGEQVAVSGSGERRIGEVAAVNRREQWRRRLNQFTQDGRAFLILPLDGDAVPLVPATDVKVFGKPVPASDRFGNAGGALHFNGQDSYAAYPLQWPSGNFTLSAWFRTQQLARGVRYLVAAEADDGTHASRRLRQIRGVVKGDAFVHQLQTFSENDKRAKGGSGRIAADRWTHVVVTFQRTKADEARMRVYLDGQPTSDNRYDYRDGIDPIAAGVTVGNSPLNPGPVYCFQGDLDDVLILERVLSPDGVHELYEASRPDPHPAIDAKQAMIAPGTAQLAAVAARDAQPAPAARNAPETMFREVVQPFVKQHCVKCHGEEMPEADLSLHALSGRIDKAENASTWSRMLDQLELAAMPPDDEPQPDGSVKKQVMEWIETELGHAGMVRDRQLLERPEFGNYVDHEKLFDGSIATPSYGAPRVWRLRPELVRVGTPFPATDVDYAAMQIVDEPMTLRLRALSETIADQLMPYMLGEKQPHRNDGHNPDAVRAYGVPKLSDPAMYKGQGAVERAKVEADVAALFEVFVARTPTDAELARYADFLEGMLNVESDRAACLATAMRAMMMTPESIYRMELGLGEQLPDGRRMLSSEELAIAVPMSLGHKKAIAGLKSRADVERAVRAMIARDRATNGPNMTPHGINPRFLDFMHQYFEYDRAVDVFKGDRHAWHAKKHARQLVEETDQIVVQILRDDRDVLRRLLTTDQIIVSNRTGGKELAHVLEFYTPGWKYYRTPIEGKKADRKTFLSAYRLLNDLSYMAYYGLEPDSELATSTGSKDVITSPVPRAGILTHPSWLQAHSTFTDNHVVHRGKWIRERLLGGTIPEVPVGVDAAIPDTPDMPLRERLAQTKSQFCWRCHRKMDPLGWPFETYDDFGRFRADGRERLINGELNDKPVDASGEITGSGEPGLDGPVKDAVELMHKLAGSDRARQVFARHVFRFFLGRNETLADSQTLIRAERTYVESGGSFSELVVSILTSDSFLYRKDSQRAAELAGEEAEREKQ